ncbi:hypothetical protein [Halobacterium salinarum]|uniref:hypothetical protein n=1 Tax=Halobacterium salinarum TaxID=2242 RepID=UPI0025565A4E|nr:hypothetical protein [Halobacterium salinarum]MDL0144597.1 hypothetical protein [Halobacterium salinarum]
MKVENIMSKIFSIGVLIISLGTLLPWGVAASTEVRATTRGFASVGGFIVLIMSILLGIYTIKKSHSFIFSLATGISAIIISIYYITNPIFPEPPGGMFVGQVFPGTGVYITLLGGLTAVSSVILLKFTKSRQSEITPS